MRKYAVLVLVAILILAIGGCAPFSPAPPTKAILEGRVLVPQGAVRQVGGQALAGATVNVIDPVTGNIVATTTTDANGYYRVEVPPGGPYIIEAVKGSIKVLCVSPQVEAGKTYPLGVADATSTAIALVFQAKVEAGEDPAEIDLEEIKKDPKFGNLAQAVEEALAAGEDPTTAPEVTHLVDVIVTPPAPKPTPKPTPKPDTTPPTLERLTAYLDSNGTREAKIVDGQWTLEWMVGETVTKIEATASESVKLVVENAVVTMSGEGKVPDDNTPKTIPAGTPYGTIAVDPSDAKKLIITPSSGNETAALVGTFTFTVAAGVVEDLAGNPNAEISVILKVGAPVYNKTRGKYYTTIQAAIGDTETLAGDTIIVTAGTYTEDVTIGKRLTITGAPGRGAPTIEGTVTIKDDGGGTSINNINFTVDAGTQDNIVLNNVSNITITGCNFDAKGRFMKTPNARAIQMRTCNNITITNCTFKDGYYVTIQGRANDVTVTNSQIRNCKSGINLQKGDNLTVYNTDISVVAQSSENDTYCVRFASSGAEGGSNMSITGGEFSVDKKELPAGSGIYHSAIIIREGASAPLTILGVTINGEVVDLSGKLNLEGVLRDNYFPAGSEIEGDKIVVP